MRWGEKGFTVVEVIIAILILSVGVLGLASTAALVTRMIGQGGSYSQATTLAAEQTEILRSQCDSARAAGSSASGNYAVNWTVTGGASTDQVTVTVSYPRADGTTRVDTFTTTIPVRPC